MSGPVIAPGEGFPGMDGPPWSAADSPLNEISAALRRINHVVVGLPIPEGDLSAAVQQLTALAMTLEGSAEQVKRPRAQPDPDRHPQDNFPTSPVIGYANPISPPVEIWAVLGENGRREIRGRVTFSYQFEGPPTCVHGGVIAEIFDEVLGTANIIGGKAGMTGTLSVRYRKPTPLMVPLDIEARVVRIEGRKAFAWGGLYCQGQLTAEADGIFIAMRPDGMVDIVATNAAGTDAPLVDPQFARLIAENQRE